MALANNGRLELTSLTVQKRTGTRWRRVSSISQNTDYRFRAVLFHRAGGVSKPNYIWFSVIIQHVNGIQWWADDSYSGRGRHGTGDSSGDVGFDDMSLLVGGKSAAEYLYFRWFGPNGHRLSNMAPPFAVNVWTFEIMDRRGGNGGSVTIS